MFHKVLLDIGYLGTEYIGWQTQGKGEKVFCKAFNKRKGCVKKECLYPHICSKCGKGHTKASCPVGFALQDVVTKWISNAFFTVLKKKCSGCVVYSRTDKGVHAFSQLCLVNLEIQNFPSMEKVGEELEKTAPKDVWLNVLPVLLPYKYTWKENKTYTYYIYNETKNETSRENTAWEARKETVWEEATKETVWEEAKKETAWEEAKEDREVKSGGSKGEIENIAWKISHPLDVEVMRKESEKLIGNHDFSQFSTRCETKNAWRTVESICIRKTTTTLLQKRMRINLHLPAKELVEITLKADGFLRHMVRRIVGHLVTKALTVSNEELNEVFHLPSKTELISPSKKPKLALPNGLWLMARGENLSG